MITASVQGAQDYAAWNFGDTVLILTAAVLLVTVLIGPRLLKSWLDAKHVINEAEGFVRAAERETQR